MLLRVISIQLRTNTMPLSEASQVGDVHEGKDRAAYRPLWNAEFES
jgi:hypothetical protein